MTGFQILPEDDAEALREADLCERTARRMEKTAAAFGRIAHRLKTEPGYRPPWFRPTGGHARRYVRYEEA